MTYVRTPRPFDDLGIARGDGSFSKRLSTLAKIDLLILDDWGLAHLDQGARNDLLEVLNDRVSTRSTLITTQLPTERWHDYLNDPTLADAILDRVLYVAHKITLTGDSLRKQRNPSRYDPFDVCAPALLAQVLIAKYADHLLLYRISTGN